MKKSITILIISVLAIISFSCTGQNSKKESVISYAKYDSCSIKSFINNFIVNHGKDFYKKDSIEIKNIINQNDIDLKNSTNYQSILKLYILHKLFTSEDASNCSNGKIINLPYF